MTGKRIRVVRRSRKVPPPLPGRGRRKPPPLPIQARRPALLRPRDLARFQNLLFSARTIVEGKYAGRHRSPFKGSSPEFVEYKVYSPGDPIDAIDWKAFARTDRHYIRLTEKQTDMNCHLLLDCSGSMAYAGMGTRRGGEGDGLSKFEYGRLLTAAMAYLMVRQGDKVSLTLFDRDLRVHKPGGGTFPHLYSLLHLMERQRPQGETQLTPMLRKCFGLFKRKGLLVIVSDFYDDPAEIFQALNLYTHRGFEVVLFHVLHEQEYRLPDVDQVRFVDMEGPGKLTCNARDLREGYDREMAGFLRALRTGAAARGMDYSLVTTEQPYHEALRKYLLRRSPRRW